MTAPVYSPAFSSAGWSWRTWLAKQKNGLKWAAAVGAGVLTGYVEALIPDPQLRALAAFGVGLGVRALLDRLDYWLSEGPA